MTVTSKVELVNWQVHEKHRYTALDKPIEVYLLEAGKVWIGLTDQLKRGMYRCKVVYHLKWRGLGEEKVVIESEEGTGQPLFVIAY